MTSYLDDTRKEPNEFWWRVPSGERANAIFATVQHIDFDQVSHREFLLHCLRMYSNRLAVGLSGQDYAQQDTGERIKLNVCKSVVDAAAAQIATNRPRVMFLTTGGSYSEKRKAKNLNRFMDGQFYAMDQYETALKVFFDASIFGTGWEHIFSECGCIKAERVFPNEIIIDDTEARDGDPRQMFRHQEVDRAVLMEQFPKYKTEIGNAGLIRSDTSLNSGQSDRVSLIQAWHLPSSKGAKDGMMAVACSDCLLWEGPWKRDTYPIVPFRIADAPLGHRGIGFVEELTSIQVEINYIAQKLQALMNLATTQVWIKKGEGIGKIDNANMGVRVYKNTPPMHIPVRPAAAEYYQQLWALFDKAFEITGVSQLAAQAKKPAGLSSGEALRTYNDISSRRFQHVGQRWERFHLAVAERVIDEAREIEERGDADSIKVLASDDREVTEIKFKDVCIAKDKYVMKAWPTALLPATPQGKIATISELSQVDPKLGAHATALLGGIPDLEAVVSRINAPYELVDLYLENMLDRGQYDPPLPYMDLNIAQQQAQLALLKAHKDGVPEERLELVRRFMDEAAAMLAPPPPPMPPPGEAMPNGPGPGPGAELPGQLPAGAPATIPGGPAAAIPPGMMPPGM